MHRPLSKSAGGLPGQDDLIREEAGGTVGLAFSATSKYIKLITSAGAEVGKSLGMVLETRLSRFEKREAFLSPLSGKDDYFHHFAESFVVLLIARREYLRL